MRNGNEYRLVSEGKECIIPCNDSFRKWAEDSGKWLRIQAALGYSGKHFLCRNVAIGTKAEG